MRVVRPSSVHHTKHLVWGVWLRTSKEDPNILTKRRSTTRTSTATRLCFGHGLSRTLSLLQDDPHMRVVRPSSEYHTKLVWGVWLRTSKEDPNILRERRRGTPTKRATKARSFTAPAFTMRPRRTRTSHPSSCWRVSRVKVSTWQLRRPHGQMCPANVVRPTRARCSNRQDGAAQRASTFSARRCDRIPKSATGPSASRGAPRSPNGALSL